MAITPVDDGTLRKLLEYLKAEVNSASSAYFTAQGETAQIAIDGLEIGRTDLVGVQKFPALMGYRTAFSGPELSRCVAVIDYFLLVSVMSRSGQDQWFTWVAKRIAIALAEYEDIGNSCMKDIQIQQARINYASTKGRAGGEMTFPYLRIQFTFEDLELVS